MFVNDNALTMQYGAHGTMVFSIIAILEHLEITASPDVLLSHQSNFNSLLSLSQLIVVILASKMLINNALSQIFKFFENNEQAEVIFCDTYHNEWGDNQLTNFAINQGFLTFFSSLDNKELKKNHSPLWQSHPPNEHRASMAHASLLNDMNMRL